MELFNYLDSQAQQTWRLLEQAVADRPHDMKAHIDRVNFLAMHAQAVSLGSTASTVLFEEAKKAFFGFLKKYPNHAATLNNFGRLYLHYNQLNEAEALFHQAIAADPALGNAHTNLGIMYSKKQLVSQAILSTEKALSLNKSLPEAWNNLALLYGMAGHADKGVMAAEHAIKLMPQKTEWYDNLLMLLLYTQQEESGRQEEIKYYYQQILETRPAIAITHLNPPDPDRRLRIAYLSGDFCKHSCSHFTEPLFAHHNKASFELFFYYTGNSIDAITHAYHAQYADHWRNLHGLHHEHMIQQMLVDEIDIAVDLSGHTSFNALSALAYRPAPVIISWLGFPGDIKLSAITCRITDQEGDPPIQEAPPKGFSKHEKLYRLDSPLYCYTPFVIEKERIHAPCYMVQDTPALQNGYLTFGSASNIIRLTHQTVALWSQVLHAVPRSRLLLDSPGLEETELQQDLQDRFAHQGISCDRLILIDRKNSPQYLIYHKIDITLDPYPCNGGTTTCDALWMGTPVITLAGKKFASRIGRSILYHANHPEWVAQTEEDFIDIAKKLAQDLDALNQTRKRLRQEFSASSMMNGVAFAQSFEQALRTLWKNWVMSPESSSAHEHNTLQEGLALCGALLEQEQYHAAQSGYLEILSHWKDCGEALFGMGMTTLMLGEDARTACSILQRAALALQRQGAGELLGDCLSMLGNAYVMEQDLQTAAEFFERSLRYKASPRVEETLITIRHTLASAASEQASKP